MNKEILNNLEEVFNKFKSNFDTQTEKIKVDLVYAFNGTGKTRISRMFTDLFENKVLCFNSMFQDEFSWDNSNSILVFNINSWIAKFIRDQGLENNIEKNFQMFCDDSIEASLDLEHGFVEFNAKTTHHALFYNSIYNLLNREKDITLNSYVLSKKNHTYLLENKGDSPFGYHLILINKIRTAINENSLEKIHFNMFRIILEKTSNYFGYKKYEQCIPDSDYKMEIIKLVNLYSHGNLPEFEYSYLTEHEKDIFVKPFNDFLNFYKVEVKDE